MTNLDMKTFSVGPVVGRIMLFNDLGYGAAYHAQNRNYRDGCVASETSDPPGKASVLICYAIQAHLINRHSQTRGVRLAGTVRERSHEMKDLAVIKRRISSRIQAGQTGLALPDATVTGTKAKVLETKCI